MAQLDLIVSSTNSLETVKALDSAFEDLINKAQELQRALKFETKTKGDKGAMDSAEAYMKRIKKLHSDAKSLGPVDLKATLSLKRPATDIRRIQREINAQGPVTIWAIIRTKAGGGPAFAGTSAGGGGGTGAGGSGGSAAAATAAATAKAKSKKEYNGYQANDGTVFTTEAEARAHNTVLKKNAQKVSTQSSVVPVGGGAAPTSYLGVKGTQASVFDKASLTARQVFLRDTGARFARERNASVRGDLPDMRGVLWKNQGQVDRANKRIQKELDAKISSQGDPLTERTYTMYNAAKVGTKNGPYYRGRTSEIPDDSRDPIAALKAIHAKDRRDFIENNLGGEWEPVYISEKKTAKHALASEKGMRPELEDILNFEKRLASAYKNKRQSLVEELRELNKTDGPGEFFPGEKLDFNEADSETPEQRRSRIQDRWDRRKYINRAKAEQIKNKSTLGTLNPLLTGEHQYDIVDEQNVSGTTPQQIASRTGFRGGLRSAEPKVISTRSPGTNLVGYSEPKKFLQQDSETYLLDRIAKYNNKKNTYITDPIEQLITGIKKEVPPKQRIAALGRSLEENYKLNTDAGQALQSLVQRAKIGRVDIGFDERDDVYGDSKLPNPASSRKTAATIDKFVKDRIAEEARIAAISGGGEPRSTGKDTTPTYEQMKAISDKKRKATGWFAEKSPPDLYSDDYTIAGSPAEKRFATKNKTAWEQQVKFEDKQIAYTDQLEAAAKAAIEKNEKWAARGVSVPEAKAMSDSLKVPKEAKITPEQFDDGRTIRKTADEMAVLQEKVETTGKKAKVTAESMDGLNNAPFWKLPKDQEGRLLNSDRTQEYANILNEAFDSKAERALNPKQKTHSEETIASLAALEKKQTDMGLAARGKIQTAGVEELQKRFTSLKGTPIFDKKGMDAFHTGFKTLQNDTDTLHGKILKLNGQDRGGGQSGFGMGLMQKWAMYMSGIAATLFVLQQAISYMKMLVGAGQGYEDVLRKMAAAAGMTANEMGRLDTTFAGIMKSQGYAQAELAGYGQELLRLGVSYDELGPAMERAAKIAEATGMKPAEAAAAAIDKVYGLTDAYLDQSKLLDGTLAKATAKMGASITLMLTAWYRAKEPDLIKFLNRISDWATKNEGKLVSSLNVFMEGLTKIGNVLGFIIDKLTTVIDLASKIGPSSEGWDAILTGGAAAYGIKKAATKFGSGAAAGGAAAATEGAAMGVGARIAAGFLGALTPFNLALIGGAIVAGMVYYAQKNGKAPPEYQDPSKWRDVDKIDDPAKRIEVLTELRNIRLGVDGLFDPATKTADELDKLAEANMSFDVQRFKGLIFEARNQLSATRGPGNQKDNWAATEPPKYMPLLAPELAKLSADVFAKTGQTGSYSQVLRQTIIDLEEQFKRLGNTTGGVADALKQEIAGLLEMQKFENWKTLIQPKMSGMSSYSSIFGGDVQGGNKTVTNFTAGFADISKLPKTYDALIEKAAENNNISADLIKAILTQENAQMNPTAMSEKDSSGRYAAGLMQIRLATAKGLGMGDADRMDPEKSLEGGARLLRQLLDQTGGNVPHAVAGYRIGLQGVKDAGGMENLPFDIAKYVGNVVGGSVSSTAQVATESLSEIMMKMIEGDIGKMKLSGAITTKDQEDRYRQSRVFSEGQKLTAPTMGFYEELFNLSGKTSEAYWANEKDKSRQKAGESGFLATDEERARYIARSDYALEVKKRQPQQKALEAQAEATGITPKALLKMRQDDEDDRYRALDNQDWMAGNYQAQEDARLAHEIIIRNIAIDGYKGQLAAGQDYFNETGLATSTYYEDEKKTLDLHMQNLRDSRKYNEAELSRLYDQRLEDLKNKFIQPQVDAYSEMYSELGIMAKEYYDIEIQKIDEAAKRIKSITGDSALADKYAKRRKDKEDIKLITGTEGWGNFEDVPTAVMKTYEVNQETAAKRVTDIWVDAVGNIEDVWKNSFFDLMEGRFKNFQDIVTNTSKVIQRALNEVAWEFLKDQLIKPGLFAGAESIFSSMGSGSGKKPSDEYTGTINEDHNPVDYSILDSAKDLLGIGVPGANVEGKAVATMNVDMLNVKNFMNTLGAGVPSGSGVESGAGLSSILGTVIGAVGSYYGGTVGVGAESADLSASTSQYSSGQYELPNWKRYANGGWINEPVVGYGKDSGNKYIIGENGPEFVGNMQHMAEIAKTAGGSMNPAPIVHVHFANETNMSRQSITQLQAAVGTAITRSSRRNS